MNYQVMMEKMLNNLDGDYNKKLLLHACCGPCSSYVLECLAKFFKITIYYYNPNIEPVSEFDKRVEELKRLIKEMNLTDRVDVIVPNYNNKEYKDAIKGYENNKEGEYRCYLCYKLRMENSVKYAKENNYDFFTTTLSISPYKNSIWLNTIGEELEKEYGVKYLYADFKKKNGYKRSIELSKLYNLYRQDYCGCIFSKYERDLRLKNEKNS